MGQELAWMLHEMRDVWIEMWSSSTYLFIIIFIALTAVTWFSVRRS